MKITSLQNDFVKHLAKLQRKKYRDEHQEYLVEGSHLLQELKKTDLDYQTIGLSEDYDIEITQHIADKISSSKSGYDEFALVKQQSNQVKFGQRHLILDDVQDPGNVGTIIRTAYSFGFDAVFLSEGSADYLNEKVIRASQGAIFHIPIYRGKLFDVIKGMKKEGIEILVTNLSDKAKNLSNIESDKLAIVLGSEGQGVSKEILDLADKEIIIETSQFDSLNVGVAGGILAYHFKK